MAASRATDRSILSGETNVLWAFYCGNGNFNHEYVTVDDHFQAWAALGMDLGNLNYQILAVEGWGGEGAAMQTVSRDGDLDVRGSFHVFSSQYGSISHPEQNSLLVKNQ
ncbi:hypothetical protein BGAL_0041g00130 [Botrytis galanthina]|uniref:endo-1,4-beta-xylanase n=1 Tax=Botrytis galanthina TaxID=278940 RepID=A0A4V6T729_9HELO|nr:hypothetical protein BGAL_0041g00130 [Botrytis galanthina]